MSKVYVITIKYYGELLQDSFTASEILRCIF